MPMYALMATIGLMFAVIFVYFRIYKAGISFKELLLYLIICSISALIGARIIFVIAMLPQIDITLSNILYYILNGGIVFYGGMFGVLCGLYLVSKILHKDYTLVINIIAPSIPLFHFFARIGCLFAGCCYGVPWPWGVVIINTPHVVRFPVQFFESVCNLIIFFILFFKEHKLKQYNGNLRIYLICYAICRFILEYFRGDSVRGIWLQSFSTAQIISLLLLLYFLSTGIYKNLSTRKFQNIKGEKHD